MQLLFTNEWLADSLIRAICWTLVHSLWQGLILSAIAGGLVLFTRKSAAAVRYNLLTTLFFVFMGIVAFTFVRELNTHTTTGTPVTFVPDPSAALTAQSPVVTEHAFTTDQPASLLARFTGYFNQHAALIVTIWFIIFLAKAVKLMGGLAYIQRIKSHKIYEPAAQWKDRLHDLADAVGIGVPVRLLESGLVKVPMVTGILKPIILVPVGLMANLPPEQVEAILLHELAHIRRRDFLVNMVQSFAETLFFFNPAVLWLSVLIREEREHCCDDVAIAVTQSKTAFVQALVSFQEYQFNQSGDLAMAFPGKRNHLLNRVKRIINNTNKTLNMAERSFLILCFCLMGILSVVFSQKAQEKKPVKKATAQQEKTLPAQETAVKEQTEKNEKQSPAAPILLDESTQQAADGAVDESSDSSYRPYQPDYTSTLKTYQTVYKPYQPDQKDTVPFFHKKNTVMSGVMTTTVDGKEYKISIDKNRATGLNINGRKIPEEELPTYYNIISSIFRQATADADKEYNDRVQESQDITNAIAQREHDRQAYVEDELQRTAEHERRVNDERAQGRLGTLGPVQAGPRATLDTQKLRLKPQVSLKRSPAEDIIEDLKKEGIVTITNPLSFSLNDKELIVNGKAQPTEVLKKFREKYVANPSNTYTYSKSGGTTSTSIVIDK